MALKVRTTSTSCDHSKLAMAAIYLDRIGSFLDPQETLGFNNGLMSWMIFGATFAVGNLHNFHWDQASELSKIKAWSSIVEIGRMEVTLRSSWISQSKIWTKGIWADFLPGTSHFTLATANEDIPETHLQHVLYLISTRNRLNFEMLCFPWHPNEAISDSLPWGPTSSLPVLYVPALAKAAGCTPSRTSTAAKCQSAHLLTPYRASGWHFGKKHIHTKKEAKHRDQYGFNGFYKGHDGFHNEAKLRDISFMDSMDSTKISIKIVELPRLPWLKPWCSSLLAPAETPGADPGRAASRVNPRIQRAGTPPGAVVGQRHLQLLPDGYLIWKEYHESCR